MKPPLKKQLAAALLLAWTAFSAQALDLEQAWQAAQQHDPELAVARAAHASADPQRRQAAALWRPGVQMSAAAGLARGETEMRNAQFSAPGMGTNRGVDFGTSVTSGAATRLAVQASQPLYHPERRAQQQQLSLMADMGELQWQLAQQSAMLRTTQHYLNLAVAQEALRVLEQQLQAVEKASTEAQERFELGAAPITAVHEAKAQLAQLQAQKVGAETELAIQRRALADATGLSSADLDAHLPKAHPQQPLQAQSLAHWQTLAEEANPGILLRQRAVEIARAEVDKHRASQSATVEMVAVAEQERLSGRGDYGSGARNKNTNAMLGVQVTVPLYTGGWRSAKEAESLAKLSEAEATLDHTRQQVAQQVHAAWLGLDAGKGQVEALEAALQASALRQDATHTGYEIGHRTLLDVLQADTAHAASRLALAQARSAVLINHLQLAMLAGQLDEQALGQANASLLDSTPSNQQ